MGYFNLLLSAILLIQIQGLFGEYDLLSKKEVLCQFEPVLSRNWYCQTDEKYHILTDPAEKLTQEEWVPFITQPGRLISRETGPRIGKFNNLNNFNFLLYNSAVKSITQAAYATPIMDVSGDSVCFTFHYNMYGAEMGSVYVTTDFTTFNTFQRIDENEVKTTETNGRREILLARGNQGDVWKDGSFKINLNRRTKVQIGLHVIKGNAVNLLSDVAFDNVKVSNDGNTCGSPAVNGNWGEWTGFGSCSVTCASGQRTATRTCNSPSPSNGGQACLVTGSSTSRALTESKNEVCNTNTPCPGGAINGNWGQWGAATDCSVTCGTGGVQRRFRGCDSPAPLNGGALCAMSSGTGVGMLDTKTEPCANSPACPPTATDGNWGQWSAYGACSVTCGAGIHSATRICNAPTPTNGGKACLLTGSSTNRALTESKSDACNTNVACPSAKTDGAWGEWANTTECSKTCGTGTRTMRRRCDNPAPANNGSECALTGTQTLALVETKNEPCSVRPCSGNFHVVVNGNWGVWAPLTQCSVTCGTGQRSEQRHCNNPQPQNGGVLCKLSFSSTTARSETRVTACNTNRNCQSTVAVNGNWGAWTNTQACSVTCGYGTRTRTRSCNSPAPSNGGQLCLQINGQRASTETLQQSCKERDCPATVGVDGNWGSWRTSSCSVTCGSGTRSRIRYCNEPSPSNGGRLCLTANGQRATNELSQQSCREQDCAVTPVASNGNWGQWTTSACSVTCGYGTRSRTRFCNSPAPGNGGQLCLMANGQRNAIETSQQSCKERDCISVTNGNWGSWEGLSACSASCGPGTQSRVRYCNNPHPQNGGLSCLLTNGMRATRDTQTSSCQLRQCVQVMDGNWGAWATSSCTTTCGYGTKTRERYCDNPTPTSGGQYCLLSNGQRARTETKQESCKERECVVTPTVINGNWGPWEGLSSCSASCGLGTQTKSRYCNSPNPENGGLACLLSNGMRATRETLTSSCQLRQCLQVVNGNWGPWEGQSACSASCGPGTRSRMRYCNSPVPQNGGLACTLSNGMRATRETLTTSCQLRQCVQVINGNWGPWEGLTACSASCGAGTQSKSRYCNSPSPLNGGLACTLSNGMRATRETLTSSCQLRQCVQVINGNWGQWGGQSACSASCGQGTQSRMRYCNSPSPSNGGLACTLSNGMRATRETLTTACQLRQCVQGSLD